MRFDVVELMEKKNIKQLPEGELDCQWLQEGEEEGEYEAWGILVIEIYTKKLEFTLKLSHWRL